MAAHDRLQTTSVSYGDQGLTIPYTPPSTQQLEVHSISLYNATAADNALGIFSTVSNIQCKFYSAASAVWSSITTAVQAATSSTIFSTTNNDGVIFQSKRKFGYVAFNVSQASTGSPVYTYKYWNGSTFATLPLLNTPSYSATGIQVLVFNAPNDWVVGSNSLADEALFSIQILATTAPSQAVKINSCIIGKMLKYSDSILQNQWFEVNFGNDAILLQQGEYIMPFFSYTNASNRLDMTYRISP